MGSGVGPVSEGTFLLPAKKRNWPMGKAEEEERGPCTARAGGGG